jgi:enamine deaminase RidA (YjgF/YER057c/UK114 family)
MPRQIIRTANAPRSPPYSQGVKADPRALVSGIVGIDPNTGRSVLPSTATARRVLAGGIVRRWTQLPTASSRPSASRACRVRRNVDSKGIRPVTPSASLMAWSALAAHSAIAVNDRAPASTAQGQGQGQDHPSGGAERPGAQ